MNLAKSPLLIAIACLFLVLTLGTLVRIVSLRGGSDEKAKSNLNSLKSWWELAAALAIALILDRTGVAILLAIAGILSLREYQRLVGTSKIGALTMSLVFAIVPLYYLLAWLGHVDGLRAWGPIFIVLAIGALRASMGLTDDYVRTTAGMTWGLLLFVYCLSHAYFLFELPISTVPWVGNAGWFLYLILLTEVNDIAQALVGRRFGKTKLTPRISPNKSLEGLLGGLVVTMMLAILIAPWLTTLMHDRSWVVGGLFALLTATLISLCGFLGDINKSGIKRDVGVKDSGTLLPGQGGMMDRIDSLTFSAPVFYYFVRWILVQP